MQFHRPVRMHEVVDGVAREIAYDPAMFDLSQSGLDPATLPHDLGFAGFRLSSRRISRATSPLSSAPAISARSADDAIRPVGTRPGGRQRHAARRGIPDFTRSGSSARGRLHNLVVYALLDSPSVAGAYRFEIMPGDRSSMDVDAALYPRKRIERLGIAPLTSMFQYGENDRRIANDWRPEIHDRTACRCGPAAANGSGARWPTRRPARSTPTPTTIRAASACCSATATSTITRTTASTTTAGPSLWVEPKSGWGKGSVQLVEIPTADETFDNIVAFWNPDESRSPARNCSSPTGCTGARKCRRRPSWRPPPHRTGIGGVVGRSASTFPGASRRLRRRRPGARSGKKGRAGHHASRGNVEIASARPLESIQGYRAMFDLRLPDASEGPIDMRLFLRRRAAADGDVALPVEKPELRDR